MVHDGFKHGGPQTRGCRHQALLVRVHLGDRRRTMLNQEAWAGALGVVAIFLEVLEEVLVAIRHVQGQSTTVTPMNSAPVGIDASGFAYDAVLLNDLFHPRMCLHKVRLVVRRARLQHKSIGLLRRHGSISGEGFNKIEIWTSNGYVNYNKHESQWNPG